MDIDRLQKLAGLEVDGDERRRLEADLERLCESIDRLGEVEVEGVEPSFQPVEMAAAIRDETPRSPPLERAEFLERVPDAVDGQVAVPQTVTGGGDDGE